MQPKKQLKVQYIGIFEEGHILTLKLEKSHSACLESIAVRFNDMLLHSL